MTDPDRPQRPLLKFLGDAYLVFVIGWIVILFVILPILGWFLRLMGEDV